MVCARCRVSLCDEHTRKGRIVDGKLDKGGEKGGYVSAVSIRSYLPGFSSNYPAQRLAYLVCVAGGIQDPSVVPQLR